jgi:hypothetical protein
LGITGLRGVLTLREVTPRHKQLVLYGKNSINGFDVPCGVHDIPENTAKIILSGDEIKFINGDDEPLGTTTILR